MHYAQGFDRDQMMTTWDLMVDPESTARLIDTFVDSLHLADYNVKGLASEGRPPYDPKAMFKLYIYGSKTGSSHRESLQRVAGSMRKSNGC